MKCIIPKSSGFCFGVKSAVDAAYEHIDSDTYMYGEVVHNPVVINELTAKGMSLIDSLDDIPKADSATVLVRAHGVPESVILDISRRGFALLDKTCPAVKKVHEIVRSASEKGLKTIIVGMPDHPEVIGILGWSGSNVMVVRDLDEAKSMLARHGVPAEGVCMVAETTHNKKKYYEIYEYCKSVLPAIEFYDTICDETAIRQREVRELAKISDCYIVVGGKHSSNVTKLYEIASEYCSNTQHIESADELDISKLSAIQTVVVVGGASTPDKSVYGVVKLIEEYCDEMRQPLEVDRL